VPHTNTKKKKICLINFERNILRKIYGPVLENDGWRLGWKNELCDIYNDLNIIEDIILKRLRWPGQRHRTGNERITKNILGGKFCNKRPDGQSRERWEDVVRRDALQILGIRGWRRKAENREGKQRMEKESRG
jgi:hypothetical protein